MVEKFTQRGRAGKEFNLFESTDSSVFKRSGWHGCIFPGAYGGEVGWMAGLLRRERYSVAGTAPFLNIHRHS